METEISLDLMMIVGTIIYLTLISPLLLRFSNYTPFILPHPQILFDPATIVIAGFTGSIIAVVILQITNLCSSKYVNSSLIKMNIFLATISVMSGTFQILLGRRESNPDYFGVDIPWEFWVEWMVTIPMIVLTIFLFNNKKYLSISEVLAVMSHVCLVVFGYSLHFNISSFPRILPYLCIAGSIYCFGVTILILIRSYSHLKSYSLTSDISDTSDIIWRSRQQVHLLSCLLFFAVSANILLYLCGVLKFLDRDWLSASCLFVNSLSRLIFSECTSSSSLSSRYQNEIMAKLEESKKADAERIAYLKYVFHEARVPLQSFTLGLELFSDPNASKEKKKEMLDVMKEANAYISHTFNDMLSIQRIESGSIDLKIQPFNLQKLIKSLITTLSSPIHYKELHLIVDISPHLPSLLLGDGTRLIHVIANLLSNSIKFSPPNSDIQLRVSSKFTSDLSGIPAFIHQPYLSSQRKPDSNRSIPTAPSTETACELCVEVIDHGLGIAESDQTKLFTPYMQVDPEKNQGGRGTGIGLALCHKIISMHGGRLMCLSKAGEGSTFAFTLTLPVVNYDRSEDYDKESDDLSNDTTDPPRSSDSDQSSPPSFPLDGQDSKAPRYFSPIDSAVSRSADTRNLQTFRSTGPPLHILVVEDSITNQRLLQRLLSLKGIVSDGVGDCHEAIRRLSKDLYRYDVILMDQMMHGMSGSETAIKLRTLGFTNIIIGLTGCAFDDDRLSFLRAGADCVLTKPINMKLFENLLFYLQRNGVRSHFQLKETICLEDMKNLKWIQISDLY